MEKSKKYFVQWIETHAVEVIAPSEKKAIEEAFRKPACETLDSADHPVVIAA